MQKIELNYPISFLKPPAMYWRDDIKISYIQRRIIVWCILYYELDNPVISDEEYGEVSKQLCKYKKQNPEAYKKSRYYYAMSDYEGSTGFDIPGRLTQKDREHLTKIAERVIKQKAVITC